MGMGVGGGGGKLGGGVAEKGDLGVVTRGVVTCTSQCV